MEKKKNFFKNRKFKKFSRYFIIFLPIILIIIGINWTFSHFYGMRTPGQITTYQFYEIFVKSMAALFTLAAVIVALFKEGIISIVKYVELEIEPRDVDFLFENLTRKEQSISNSSQLTPILQKAESYETFLVVKNYGNKIAEGCTIQVEEILFEGESFVNHENIDVSNGNFLTWNSNSQKEISIYPNNKAIISVLKIVFIESNSTPGNAQSKQAQLKIGDFSVNDDYTNGSWTVTFILCSKNSKIQRFKLKIRWNGDWHPRMIELKKILTIEKVK